MPEREAIQNNKALEITARHNFENRMKIGVRPQIYCMIRLSGGEYLSRYTEDAWQDYKAGFYAAIEEFCSW